jgi:hypothetical protein
MKRAGKLTYLLISFTMFLATFAFGANKGSLHVESPFMAGETQLPAGEYTVQWEGAGPDVELKIKRHSRVEATVRAKMIPLDRPVEEDAAVIGIDRDGGRRLLEIRFSGKKFVLQIEPQTALTTTPRPPSQRAEYGSNLAFSSRAPSRLQRV